MSSAQCYKCPSGRSVCPNCILAGHTEVPSSLDSGLFSSVLFTAASLLSYHSVSLSPGRVCLWPCASASLSEIGESAGALAETWWEVGSISLASVPLARGPWSSRVGSGGEGDLGGLKCSEGPAGARVPGDPLTTRSGQLRVKAEARRLQLELWLRD